MPDDPMVPPSEEGDMSSDMSACDAIAEAFEIANDDPDFPEALATAGQATATINEDGSVTLVAGEAELTVDADMIAGHEATEIEGQVEEAGTAL